MARSNFQKQSRSIQARTPSSEIAVTRRYWPIILALLSVLVFGSYLAYTNHLVSQIRAESQIHSQMYAIVQRGLISLEEDGALTALVDLQKSLGRLGVPIVVVGSARARSRSGSRSAGSRSDPAGRARHDDVPRSRP